MNENDLFRVMQDIGGKYTDEAHRYADELDTMKRRKGTMKQKVKTKAPAAQFLPWKFGIGVAVAACAAIAIIIGGGIISLDKQMQVGSNVGTSNTEQLSEREPIEITDYRIEGFDVVMGVPETGTAQLLHTVEDAQPWVELVRQNGEYGRSTGEGAEDFRALLENEEIYQDYDVIMTAVPYQFVYQDSGVAMYGFDGGTVTPGGSLTVEMRFLTVGNAMPERIFQQIDTFCCCFAVPKNTVPEITAFTFHDVIYDCTSPLPDGCDTREAHLDYLYSLPNYQEFMGKELTAKYLRFAKDDIQTGDAAHEPVLLTELLSFSATDEMAIKVPNSGIAEIWHSMNDAAQIMQSDVVNFEEYFSEDVFAEYDVLYLAHPLAILPENLFRFHPSSGTFLTNGALQINLAALSLSELPEGWSSDPDRLNSVNHYWFYTVPKNKLPEIGKWEYDVTDYQIGELPENAKDVRGGDSAFMEYLLTTEAYQGWENEIGATMYITWEKSESVLPEGCIEVKTEATGENG